MQEDKPIYIEQDEVTLKDIVDKLNEYYKEVLKNWKLLFLVTLTFVMLMFYKAFTTSNNFPANLTFMLNEDERRADGLGGLASIVGLGVRSGNVNLEKMLRLAESRKIIQEVLFEKISLNNKKDFYANHIIEQYNLHDEWEDSDLLKDFNVFSNDNLNSFTRAENQALKYLHKTIIGREGEVGLLSTDIDEDTGIITIGVGTTKESLSIGLVNTIYEKLSRFYIDQSIEQQQKTYQLTKNKTDSLRIALDAAQFQVLRINDSNRNLSLRQYEIEELRLKGKVQLLSIAYGEAFKNQEIASFALQSKTPFIQLIDLPLAPLTPSKNLMTYIKNILIGGFLGGFLSIGYIVCRKILNDAMGE